RVSWARDVYKRQLDVLINNIPGGKPDTFDSCESEQMLAAFSQKALAYIDMMKRAAAMMKRHEYCLLYTSDA
ncbi:hypothetical protein ACQ4LK_24305, partial [Bacillus pumilus]